ncbi:hypothetical protein SLE2022_042440 [Rubroshorea leprosula]
MPSEVEIRAGEGKNVVVGIRIDNQSRDLLSWALGKVAEPGDCVIAVHVTQGSDNALRGKLLMENYLEVYEGLCSVKKVALKGQIFRGSSARKVLVREAKNFAAVALVVGVSKKRALSAWTSTAKYCARRLPPTTDILAIHNGKIIFRSCNNKQQPGLKGDPKPSFCLPESPTFKEYQSEFGDSEVGTEVTSSEGIQSSKDESRHGSEDSKDEIFSVIHEEKGVYLRKSSPFSGDILEHRPGWPLLQRHMSGIPQASQARNVSVVQWVMNLPTRSSYQISQCSTIEEGKMEREVSGDIEESTSISSSALCELWRRLEILLETKSSKFKWFSYGALKVATSQFSSENLIGRGGCNHVYKGILPDGKPVAVKILKSSEAWEDFAHEVDIISSIKHKHIMPLIGVCIEDNDLISVYDLSSKGSLEENLHGKNKDKHALSWEVRYNIAVGIAEALNYLHNECSQPVIHRDVKSSNILLSDEFEPQLSDFGLAMRGPTTSSFLIQDDVLGTFGYLAPEYFMYGKVSDKIDVYAFGVVLLELLSGKEPISSEIPKGQESLVMWAKPTIESGDVKSILDPDLDKNINELQLEKMVLAANLCLTCSSRLRPNISEILKLLRGQQDVEKWINLQNENTENQDDNDDEVYPNSRRELHLGLALLSIDDDSPSFSSIEQSTNLSSEEYLKESWSRSSSFN